MYYFHLSKSQIDKYKIMSRESCERYCRQKHEKTSIIISISSSWDKVMPSLPINETNNVKHILSLTFDDVDYFHDPKHCMTENDAFNAAIVRAVRAF